MSEANKELSRRFTELFSTGDEALAEKVLSRDIVFHGTTGDGKILRRRRDEGVRRRVPLRFPGCPQPGRGSDCRGRHGSHAVA